MTTATDPSQQPPSEPADRDAAPSRLALVTGATGYVGGQLVPALLEAGWGVRVLTRSRDRLPADWVDRVEVTEGDAEQPGSWDQALDGVDTAYFLLHSMDGVGDFAARDRAIATDFAAAAGRSGVRRVVYLGGLHPRDHELSTHLASRKEVGDILLAGPVPTIVLQAAVVIGAGSASFEMLRYLTGRLPAMVAPKWLHNRMQPIAIADVVRYLVAAPELPDELNRTFDIGGPEVLTYAELIHRCAAAAGLRRRLVVTVPVLTPRLASHWVGVVTPLSPGLAKPLVESLVHDVVCSERDITEVVPAPGGLVGVDIALADALRDSPPDTGPRNLASTAAVTAAAAVAGSLLTQPRSRWYAALDKPAWQPPAVAFPIVWPPLYGSLATTTAAALTELDRAAYRAAQGPKAAVSQADISATRVDRQARGLRRALLTNLVLNATWNWTFFRGRRLWPAAGHAALLAASSADLSRRVGRARPGLGTRLLPYAAWTAFATALNAEVARRNPARPAAVRRGPSAH